MENGDVNNSGVFQAGDEIVSKVSGDRAVVLYIMSEEHMVVRFRTGKFSGGHMDTGGITAVTKHFEHYNAALDKMEA